MEKYFSVVVREYYGQRLFMEDGFNLDLWIQKVRVGYTREAWQQTADILAKWKLRMHIFKGREQEKVKYHKFFIS